LTWKKNDPLSPSSRSAQPLLSVGPSIPFSNAGLPPSTVIAVTWQERKDGIKAPQTTRSELLYHFGSTSTREIFSCWRLGDRLRFVHRRHLLAREGSDATPLTQDWKRSIAISPVAHTVWQRYWFKVCRLQRHLSPRRE